MAKKSGKYKKAYRSGYNNPSQWNQSKLLTQPVDDFVRGAIDGICQRKTDDQNGCVEFIK